MKSLYLRIYLPVVVALALFALVSGWLVQRHLEDQRARSDENARDRRGAWAELLARSLPPPESPREEQAMALRDWSQRLRLPMALDDAQGQRIGTSENFARRESEGRPAFQERLQVVRLDDGRSLRLLRPGAQRGPPGGLGRGGAGPLRDAGLAPGPDVGLAPWLRARGLPDGLGLALLLVVLFAAVAAGAYPVVRRLTRRLELLKQGVEAFGRGELHQRVAEDGRDEVATLAASFNQAATRVQALLRSHQSLLANASHELRSPLARLKLALAMLDDAPPAERTALKREIHTNIAELDALVEEVLLSSRLDTAQTQDALAPVELLALAAEEGAKVGAEATGEALVLQGDERLLRRALRNLLENGRRYGARPAAGAGPSSEPCDDLDVSVSHAGNHAQVRVADRGPGVPEAERERIFEAFYRLPGHAERAGGVGLGLALVRQIAHRHGGRVHCEARPGGGSCFVLSLPLEPAAVRGMAVS